MGNKNTNSKNQGYYKQSSFEFENVESQREQYLNVNYYINEPIFIFFSLQFQEFLFRPFFKNNQFSNSMKYIHVDFKGKQAILNIGNNNTEDFLECLWVQTNLPSCDYVEEIQVGDTFKLGNSFIQFSKINIVSQNQISSNNMLLSDIKSNLLVSQSLQYSQNISQKKSKVTCRICYGAETFQNPFAQNICKCSQQNPTHLKCLVQWIKTKVKKQITENRVYYYDYQQIKCDLCLEDYPRKLFYKGQQNEIFEIQCDNKKDYFIIDIYNNGQKQLSGQYYVSLDNNQKIILGRAGTCVVKFEDQQVSAIHSEIVYKDYKLHIFDKNSTFGTLRLAREKEDLQKNILKTFVYRKFAFQIHPLKSQKQCKCRQKIKYIQKNPISNINHFNQESMREFIQKSQQITSENNSLKLIQQQNQELEENVFYQLSQQSQKQKEDLLNQLIQESSMSISDEEEEKEDDEDIENKAKNNLDKQVKKINLQTKQKNNSIFHSKIVKSRLTDNRYSYNPSNLEFNSHSMKLSTNYKFNQIYIVQQNS